MRLRTPAYGGSWVPVFEASKDCSESQTCWPIGISALEIYCIITPANSNGPQVDSSFESKSVCRNMFMPPFRKCFGFEVQLALPHDIPGMFPGAAAACHERASFAHTSGGYGRWHFTA